jgi:hypothetical protein
VNSLKIRLAAMKASRDRWKQQALQLEFVEGMQSEPLIKNAPARPSPRCRHRSTAGTRSSR